mmetsp:Transcript_2182/g.5895  ORF Transcript_2182/g.5895 Transcript_2182/m.5895 type:complete len:218 (-) Transcript_2182:563-1216(-)
MLNREADRPSGCEGVPELVVLVNHHIDDAGRDAADHKHTCERHGAKRLQILVARFGRCEEWPGEDGPEPVGGRQEVQQHPQHQHRNQHDQVHPQRPIGRLLHGWGVSDGEALTDRRREGVNGGVIFRKGKVCHGRLSRDALAVLECWSHEDARGVLDGHRFSLQRQHKEALVAANRESESVRLSTVKLEVDLEPPEAHTRVVPGRISTQIHPGLHQP